MLRRNGYCSSFPITLIILILTASLLCCAGCDGAVDQEALALQEQASTRYKQRKDYASLLILSESLKQGMEQKEVIALLGKPEYSPLEGLFYYSSDRRERVRQGKEEVDVVLGLIVDYRDGQGRVTKQLQGFELGRIGE